MAAPTVTDVDAAVVARSRLSIPPDDVRALQSFFAIGDNTTQVEQVLASFADVTMQVTAIEAIR